MGTSFVDFKNHGFWTRDPVVEVLLGGLVVELEPEVGNREWLDAALDHWALHAVAGFSGHISPDFDWYLADPERLELVVAAARRFRMKIHGDASVVIDGESFGRRAARVAAGDWNRPEAGGSSVGGVIDALVLLLEGSLVAPGEASLFIGEDGSYYLNEPPMIESRRWLLAADLSAPASGDYRGGCSAHDVVREEFDAVLEAAADSNFWSVTVEALHAPALSKTRIEAQRGEKAVATIFASTRGRLVSALPEPRRPGGRVISDSRVSRVLATLSSKGWRYVPLTALAYRYDGIDDALRAAEGTWSERLFGMRLAP